MSLSRFCNFCGGAVPADRVRKSPFCSDSCHTEHKNEIRELQRKQHDSKRCKLCLRRYRKPRKVNEPLTMPEAQQSLG
jgi:hypothetical protein